MNTTGIIGLVIAVIVVGGGVWYFSSHPATPGGGTEGTSTSSGDAMKGAGTFASLAALTGSVTCDVASVAGDAQSSGTVHMSNGQMRADFNSTTKATGEAVIESHMIRAGGFLYTWSSAAPQGVKMSDAVLAQTGTTGKPATSGVDPNTQVTYSCVPWVTDAAQFTPPSTVTFMNVSAMMQSGTPTGAMPVKGTTYPQGPTKQPYAY